MLLLGPALAEQLEQTEDTAQGHQQEERPGAQRLQPHAPGHDAIARGLVEAGDRPVILGHPQLGEQLVDLLEVVVVAWDGDEREQVAREEAPGHGHAEHQHRVHRQQLTARQVPAAPQPPQHRVHAREHQQAHHRRHRRHAALDLAGVVHQRDLLHHQAHQHREHQRNDQCPRAGQARGGLLGVMLPAVCHSLGRHVIPRALCSLLPGRGAVRHRARVDLAGHAPLRPRSGRCMWRDRATLRSGCAASCG